MCTLSMEVEVSRTRRVFEFIILSRDTDFGMSTNFKSLRASDCTSCGVTQDMSAYWTPALYFMHTDGRAELVPEVGGMLAYVEYSGLPRFMHRV